MNGGVCTGRAANSLSPSIPPGGGNPVLTPCPAAAPDTESPKGQEEGELNPRKEPAGEGGFVPALSILSPTQIPIRAPRKQE